jgi:sphinganine-1-phosphate aldolase
MITPAHEGVAGAYLADLKESVENGLAHPEAASEGNAAMYGMLARLPDRGTVNEMLLQYIDDLYSL